MSLTTLPVVVTLSAERALINQSLVRPTERHPVVLQLDDRFGRFATHVVYRVLVSEPVAALDGVVVVPFPVVRLPVTQGGVDTSCNRDN